jgi:hypothetical protein
VYAVAQFYFILQGSLTRAGLSVLVNGIVFAVGTLTLMLLLRSHLKIPTSAVTVGTPVPAGDEASLPASSTEDSNAPEAAEAAPDSQAVQASGESPDDQAASGVENMEQSDQDTGSNPESQN